jgi:quercetin dioxygenase-like cupin family protein
MMTPIKTKILSLIVLLLACVLLAAGQAPIQIEKEPMHRLKLENDLVRVFDVLVPAGKTTLFHTHSFDGVSVRVSNAEMSELFTDARTNDFKARWGVVTFGSAPPYSHMVINKGKTDFRNIYVELKPRQPANEVVPPLIEMNAILIDNPRVRVNRRVLKPGETTGPHTHVLNCLSVAVYDAEVEISSSGMAARTIKARAGDVVWQAAGTNHSIRNVGSTDFVAIEIEVR